jgi:MoaA/NifB/PqqE/SkfB family radical SAM enzyme
MELLGKYLNGNYEVEIYDNGTKIRETIDKDATEFVSEFPECMDVKITNYCDMNCPYCHENSSTEGSHANLWNLEFINTLRPYTEMAIGGGNPLSHPDLEWFLKFLKGKNIIANITINQEHFVRDYDRVKKLSDAGLIKGLGISVVNYTEDLGNKIINYPNAVIHIINGIIDINMLKQMYDKGLKVLILGYKQFRKGSEFYSDDVETRKEELYDELSEAIKHFKVTSFDNLAIRQLDVKRLMSKEKWDEFYMGDDGSHTMYIDLVNRKFAQNSTSNKTYGLLDVIDDMFGIVKGEHVAVERILHEYCDKLSVCPFCGGKAWLETIEYTSGDTWYHPECSECLCGLGHNYDLKEEAIDEWNKRA